MLIDYVCRAGSGDEITFRLVVALDAADLALVFGADADPATVALHYDAFTVEFDGLPAEQKVAVAQQLVSRVAAATPPPPAPELA